MVQRASDHRPDGDNTDFYRAAIQEVSPEWFDTFAGSYIDDAYGFESAVAMGKFVTAGGIVILAPTYLSKGGGLLSHHEIATKRRIEGDPGSLDTRIPLALNRAAEQGIRTLGPAGGAPLMTDAGHFIIEPQSITIFEHSAKYGPGDQEARELTIKTVQETLPNVDVIVEKN